jgi:hypothetical protein
LERQEIVSKNYRTDIKLFKLERCENGYLSFLQKQSFTKILSKIDETIVEHESYKRPLELGNKLLKETAFIYVFHSQRDKNMELFLTILAFQITVK